jgi:hypothetical protein
MSEFRRTLIVVAVLLSGIGVLFHRSVLRGEVLSPADLLFSYPPWSHDTSVVTPSNPTRSDDAVYHQPLMATHWTRLRDGDLPQWDPLVLAGTPAFFQGLNAGLVFSPLSLPFYLLPADVAVTVAAPLRLLAAGLCMWILLRGLGLSMVASLTGAVAFAFNGAFVTWLSAPMPAVALFLPLVLLLVDRTIAKGGRYAVALALVLAVAITGAYLPTTIVLFATTIAYAAWMSAMTGRWRRAIPVAAAVGGSLVVAAVALAPMLVNLFTSAASGRAVSHVHLPWANLATFAMPNFWGSPVDYNWWYTGDGNYPEFVTYLGVVPILLAGARLAAFPGGGGVRAHPRAAFFAAAALFTIIYMYGVPPVSWLGRLPGLRQTNPFRFNVVLAMSVAVLAAYGIDTIRERPRRAIVGIVGAAGLLVVGVGIGLAAHLDTIRALGLQNYEKAQLIRFVALSAGTLLCCQAFAWRRVGQAEAWQHIMGGAVIVLVAGDLISALWRFNPTLPRDRAYPETAAIDFLQRQAAGARIAPVGNGHELLQGHVWSTYGLQTLTGFDFHGDRDYQALLARAQGTSAGATKWDYVGIDRADALNLKLLGLLNARLLFTSPFDVRTRGGGLVTTGELVAGRALRQSFVSRQNGLRRVDVMTATFGRRNEGMLQLSLLERSGHLVAARSIESATVPNNGWLRLDFAAQPLSRDRAYVLELRALSGEAGKSVTAWATLADGYPDGGLEADGRPATGDLWFRTFATAPARFRDAGLVYAHDLNVYRNSRAQPRAWFVQRTERLPHDRHLDRLADPAFDPATTALLEGGRDVSPGATVESIDLSDPDARRIRVRAPQGGLLIISERYDPNWTVSIDGRDGVVLRANLLLVAADVPAGAREVVLRYRSRPFNAGMIISVLGLLSLGAIARTRSPREFIK